ncbi:conserved hypothetical protein [Thermosulfidibacter takaii ABI70S6]|uniref:Epoxyqueuosine reductase QueH n=1 Tax=Thermosulfidibacter takaii (strain DSM 17441 / JCM 13301 / NBRC 103674 / ABI70S6) TaxID=1298851 RepID=A0A0S3QS03_THET7|nr:epoxyqueuosine reductase QueH [Thermosulfidibacter takaii]BAT71118.1 conserved hypothetical protein [Thermosulfidibacter takaii ABI70S6]
MARVLIHACCANCLLYPLQVLRESFNDVFVFWYNPNIHPYTEYTKRLEAMEQLEKAYNLKVIYNMRYDIKDWIQMVAFREDRRCMLCYHDRLKMTAAVAKKGNFDYFTSTLLYSKHQKHELIREIGESVGKEKGVKFFYYDFREGWKEGIQKSLSLKLYRQQYCGCIYSEQERFKPKR